MAVGGCFCGNVRIEYSGQHVTSVSACLELRIVFIDLIEGLCHCFDCRKLTGTLYTYNFVIDSADLKTTGSPKEVAKTADSGNYIKNYFCSDCGAYTKPSFVTH